MIQTEREYAQALYTIAVEENAVDEYRLSLEEMNSIIADEPDYIEFLASPAVPLSERLDCIDKAFAQMPEYTVSFVKVLCENGRIRTLGACIEEFLALSMEFSNRTFAEIYSAVPLDETQKAALCKKLEKLTGKTVSPIYYTDKSLIGGLKIEVDGKTFDGTVRHRLSEIKDVMNS